MKALSTLVKLNKKKLDDILLSKKKTEAELDQFTTQKEHIMQQAQKEIEQYQFSEFAYMLDSYLQNYRKTLEQLDAQINILASRVQRLEDELHYQFSELKTFEMVLKNRQKAEIEKNKIAEAKFLDEYNTNKYARENTDK